MPAADHPAMPSPARAADQSIALAIRLGVPRDRAARMIAGLCAVTRVRLADQGCTDMAWIWAVERRALQRAGRRSPQTSLPTSGQGEREGTGA